MKSIEFSKLSLHTVDRSYLCTKTNSHFVYLLIIKTWYLLILRNISYSLFLNNYLIMIYLNFNIFINYYINC